MILVWIKQKRILTLKLQEQWQKRLKKMQRCTAKAERRAKNKLFGHLTYNNPNYSLEIERTREELLKLQSEMGDTVSVKNFP